MAQGAYDVCKRCNRSYALLHDAQNFYQPRFRADADAVAPQDVAHLSEDQQEQPREGSRTRDNRNLSPEYRSLCEIVTRKVHLDDTEYEYQPPHYHEVYCKDYFLLNSSQRPASNLPSTRQKCVHPGFHCVQRSKTVFLVRRRWDSECWEPYVREIASGCDCMWPVSVLGDITDHY